MNNLPYTRQAWLLLSLLIAISSACKKYNGTNPNQNQNNALSAKLIKFGDAINNNQFEYDTASNIYKLTIVTDSIPTEYSVTYQNGVAAQLQSANFTNKLTYDSGHLIRSEVYNNTTGLQSMGVYGYSGDNVSEETLYESLNYGSLEPQLKYKFETLPNSDIGMTEIFLWNRTTGQFNFAGSYKYAYDDHRNPVYDTKDLYMLFNLPTTPHNIRTITSYDALGVQISLTTYDYTYNSTGCPVQVKRTDTPTGGFDWATTLSYAYQ